MWETLSHPWQAGLEQAWAAYCFGSVPVGAVVTDGNGKILSRGRNRTNDTTGGEGVLHGQTLAHAELNALIKLRNDELDRHSCILYTTLEPCPLCLGAFYMSSIRQLCYAARDPFAGSVNLLGKTSYLKRKPVRVSGPDREDLEIVLLAILVEFELRTRDLRPDTVLKSWESVVPKGVHLGEDLYRSGQLQNMKEKKFMLKRSLKVWENLFRIDP